MNVAGKHWNGSKRIEAGCGRAMQENLYVVIGREAKKKPRFRGALNAAAELQGPLNWRPPSWISGVRDIHRIHEYHFFSDFW